MVSGDLILLPVAKPLLPVADNPGRVVKHARYYWLLLAEGASIDACSPRCWRGIVKLTRGRPGEDDLEMKSTNPYAGYRYPGEVIAHAVWLYHRFCLSFRDAEDLLAERGVIVSHETIRQWCLKFDRSYGRSLRRCQGRPGATWFLDEVFITINGGCTRHPGCGFRGKPISISG